MQDTLKAFAQNQDIIYASAPLPEKTTTKNFDMPMQEPVIPDDTYTKRKNEFHEAIIKFQKNFTGLKYDKDMKINEKAIFKYVSHSQLIKMISKSLAEVGLGHSSTNSLKDGILSVCVTLFHKNGFSKSSNYDFPFPAAIFSDGVKTSCTRYTFNSKVEKVSSMTYLHELAKASALASKYALQSMLGLAGGEVDESEEEIVKPKSLSPPNYERSIEHLKNHAINNKIGTIAALDRITKDPGKEPKEKLDELRKYIKKQKMPTKAPQTTTKTPHQ